MGSFTTRDLAHLIEEHAASGAKDSRTVKLLARGVEHCGKKLVEEAGEVTVAALVQDDQHMIEEAADLLFHLALLLKCRNIPLLAVEMELFRRTLEPRDAKKAIP